MHTPSDYKKSIWTLGISEIIIYTLTGALIYSFVGQTVESPALLSAGKIPAKVAFGLGLPVIYISGSINTTVVGRYIHERIHKDNIKRYINTKGGWIAWLSLVTAITIIAWIIAESIPFFNDLLALSSALFITGFTFYFPSLMWFFLLREGPWYAKKNLMLAIINFAVGAMGIAILIGGTWASIADIVSLCNPSLVVASALTMPRNTCTRSELSAGPSPANCPRYLDPTSYVFQQLSAQRLRCMNSWLAK